MSLRPAEQGSCFDSRPLSCVMFNMYLQERHPILQGFRAVDINVFKSSMVSWKVIIPSLHILTS